MSTMEDQASTPQPEVIIQHSSIAAQNSGVNVPHITGCSIGSLSMNLQTNVHTAATLSANAGKTQDKASDIDRAREKLKCCLSSKFETIFEGLAKRGNPALLRKIYTELHITEGERGALNKEHEVRMTDVTPPEQDKPVSCNDIFKSEKTRFRTVLSVGIASIGKTVSVHKFILDWVEGKANQDVDLLLPLSFHELNSFKDTSQSLHKLLLDFYSELKAFGDTKFYADCKIIFIFDGLDESKLPLDFGQKKVSDVSSSASLDVLITNLIEGNLLPSALVWITSRPAAIDKIPPDLIHRMTEVRGFTDLQKEEYFRKRISDQSLACRIISHVKGSRSLKIMCHIPVFCWITSTVLEHKLKGGQETIHTSLTEMYTRFLLFQTSEKKKKYHGIRVGDHLKLSDNNVQLILKLGKLAFDGLWKSNFVFSEDDLRKYDIDVGEASLRSGVFTEVFRQEDPMFSVKTYSFVHLSFQEYFSAFYVVHTFADNGTNAMLSGINPYASTLLYRIVQWFCKTIASIVLPQSKVTLYDLHKCAIDEALKSRSGHLDLFLRFLLGLSVDTNQKLLKSLSMSVESGQKSTQQTVQYLKSKLSSEDSGRPSSSNRCISLIHCLLELRDDSMADELKRFQTTDREAESEPTDEPISVLCKMISRIGDSLDEQLLISGFLESNTEMGTRVGDSDSSRT